MKTKWNPFVLLILFALLFSSCGTGEVQNGATSADGVTIAFNQQGKGNPAIIFVHGWTNPKEIWDDQVKHFSQKYKTVAVDLAGSGESGNNRTSWTIPAFADDVVSVIDKLKLKDVVLVGFSMGAPVVVETANKLPEKVNGIVIVDALQNPDVKYTPEMAAFMDSLMMDVVTNMTNEKLTAMGFYKKNHEASFNRLGVLYPEGVSKVGWNESLKGLLDWENNQCRTALKSLKVPVIAINSDSRPTMVEAWQNYVPSFKANIMTDVGHLLFWDNPDEFHRLLEESINEFK